MAYYARLAQLGTQWSAFFCQRGSEISCTSRRNRDRTRAKRRAVLTRKRKFFHRTFAIACALLMLTQQAMKGGAECSFMALASCCWNTLVVS